MGLIGVAMRIDNGDQEPGAGIDGDMDQNGWPQRSANQEDGCHEYGDGQDTQHTGHALIGMRHQEDADNDQRCDPDRHGQCQGGNQKAAEDDLFGHPGSDGQALKADMFCCGAWADQVETLGLGEIGA